ncbi:hypothetical protein ACVIYL_001535 [Bradyrhizobium sp. USDA 3315]
MFAARRPVDRLGRRPGEVLRRGGDLTRAGVMKQAASRKQFAQGGLLPGVTLNTGPDDFQLTAREFLFHGPA